MAGVSAGDSKRHSFLPQEREPIPSGHQQRKIPGDDLPHHTDRLFDVHGHRLRIDLRYAALFPPDHAGEIAEMVGSQRDVSRQRLPDRFSIVPGFGESQRL